MKESISWKALWLILLSLTTACTSEKATEKSAIADTIQLAYAQNFRIIRHGHEQLLQSLDGDKVIAEYHLYKEEKPADSVPDYQKVKIPVTGVIALSSPYIAILNALSQTDKLVAIPESNFSYSSEIVQKARNGQLPEVGNYTGINKELLVSLHPDAIFTSFTNTSYDTQDKIRELGLTAVSVTSHLEDHPLGKTEWVKFFGAFFGKEKEADSIFRAVEEAYNEKKDLVSKTTDKPKVLAGYYKSGTWVAPGGKSYFARLLADAGADYVLKDNQENGNITLNFENALQMGLEADILFFMNMGTTSLQDLLALEPRLKDFKGVANHQAYSNTGQINEAGKNNYWEQGFMEPHVILQDLIKILHPEMVKDNGMVYMKRLE